MSNMLVKVRPLRLGMRSIYLSEHVLEIHEMHSYSAISKFTDLCPKTHNFAAALLDLFRVERSRR